MPDFYIYELTEAPVVEVEIDGRWWPGEARMQTTYEDGSVTYQALVSRDGVTYLGQFPAERVRLDSIGRSRRRG